MCLTCFGGAFAGEAVGEVAEEVGDEMAGENNAAAQGDKMRMFGILMVRLANGVMRFDSLAIETTQDLSTCLFTRKMEHDGQRKTHASTNIKCRPFLVIFACTQDCKAE